MVLLSYGGGKMISGVLQGDWGNGNLADRTKAIVSDETIKEYVAVDHGFTMQFPGFPIISNERIPIEGYDVPMTMYEREIKNGEEAYFAIVWDYQRLPMTEDEITLEGALNGMAQNMEGATLNTSTQQPLGGLPGLEGTITVPVEGKSYESFARLTKRGMKMYGVWTIGAPYADFEIFATSFQFHQ
jgi:hypothetical protein